MPSISVCLILSHGWIEVEHFWQEYQRSDVSFLVCPLPSYMVSICFTTGDVNLDYLVKVKLPGFLTVKLLFVSL